MGATKESPATQILEWAVGKLDEASKTDWAAKFSALTASKPAYLRHGVLTPAPATPGNGLSGGGTSQGALDAALGRARAAEAQVAALSARVTELEAQLAGPAPDGVDGEEHHRSHWWSRQH